MKTKFFEYREHVLSHVTREGVLPLLDWLYTTDINEAPASTTFHGNYAGGLIDHLMNVHKALLMFRENDGKLANYTDETLAIVALFHDLCKVHFYSIGTRNVKNEKTGLWEKKPFYKRDEKFAYGGHGSKSVFLVMQHMELSPEEAAAINSHMGAWDHQDYGNPGEVFQQSKLAWYLHVADEYATYYLDKTEV